MRILKNGIDASQIYEEPARGGNGLITGRRGGLDRDVERGNSALAGPSSIVTIVDWAPNWAPRSTISRVAWSFRSLHFEQTY